MKIQLASDLHLEFLQRDWPGERLIDPVPAADVLVLAGDIANGATAFKLFANWPSAKKIPIIIVAGNHEFYNHAMESMREKMREEATKSGIYFLENESIEIDGVRFLGATLWTDYKLVEGYEQKNLMQYCEARLNDHRLIRFDDRPFSAQDALDQHEVSRAWLEAELAKPFDGKTVVITHHGPHPGSTHPRYKKEPMNAAFVSDLSNLMPGADLWMHGHVHDGFNYQVGRCRVVANPAGYIKNRGAAMSKDEFRFENETWDQNMLIEI